MITTVVNRWSHLRAQFDRDGYVIARNVIDADLVEEGRRHVEWLLARNPGTRPEQLHHNLMTRDPFWVRLISDERLLDVAQEFVGPDIALFASHYIAKPPYDGEAVLWHQDGSFWPLEPMEVVTLWLSLDEVTPENGCMRVVPGTQHESLGEVISRKDVVNVLQASMDESLVDESQAVEINLSPGDVSVHHPNIFHGSHANTSPRWRRGLTIRYIPTSTKILTNSDEPWASAFLLRGQERPGVNKYQPRPKYVEGESLPFRGCEAWR
jgi:ectoine hydroxylase-related dioxygenase (phytanoyl-CoA dioxygenase family)